MRLSLLFLFLIFSIVASAQTITIPYDTNSVTIDGTLNSTEWQHHAEIIIPNTSTDSVIVWCKHDMNSLYFAFSGNLDAGVSSKFPEVLLDPAYARTASWQAGQWWLHVSATDCEHDGAYGIYDSCAVTQPSWEGAPNFIPGPPTSNMVEIKVPFSKIGFNSSTQDTLGLSVLVSNTINLWKLWPVAADTGKPNTWSTAIISKVPASVNDLITNKGIQIYPNPAHSNIHIEGLKYGDALILKDISGRSLKELKATANNMTINIEELPAGLYLLQINDQTEKVRVVR